MKVEIVSVGTPLLMSDIVDINSSHVTRSLREIDVRIICRATVGEDLAILVDVLGVAAQRADVVLVIGGGQENGSDLVKQAVSQLTGRELDGINCLSYTTGSDLDVSEPGVFVDDALLVCLPTERREMAYLLENRVLPYLQQRQQQELAAAAKSSGWILLRAVGVMESSVRQQLADLSTGSDVRLTLNSYAGQTDIRLWAQAANEAAVQQALAQLRQEVMLRLGDHIYGEGRDRLEQVVLNLLARSDMTLALAECFTSEAVAQLLHTLGETEQYVSFLPVATGDELAEFLQMEQLMPDSDLSRWCRNAAQMMLNKMEVGLGLVVYNNITPGGVQILVTLASANGVSVTQRSFSGHPESIDQWASTLGLAHLRRWLLVHT
ncbi:MAG: molybdopterin-binding protein [Chloroflexota bacterium]